MSDSELKSPAFTGELQSAGRPPGVGGGRAVLRFAAGPGACDNVAAMDGAFSGPGIAGSAPSGRRKRRQNRSMHGSPGHSGRALRAQGVRARPAQAGPGAARSRCASAAQSAAVSRARASGATTAVSNITWRRLASA